MNMNKKGDILVENVVFIILNLLFLGILVAFLITTGRGVGVLEQAYAKQIALIVDSAQSEMEVYLDMSKGFEKVREETQMATKDIVTIDNEKGLVTVRLSPDSGYTYSFFKKHNQIDYYPTKITGEFKSEGGYIFRFPK